MSAPDSAPGLVEALPQAAENFGRYLRRAAFVSRGSAWGPTPLLRARFNDAVFMSVRRGFLFASNEKVANSTLRATFQTLEAGGGLPPLYKPFKRWTGPLAQPSDLADFSAVLAPGLLHKFCVVRHPYARLVSCFRNKLEAGSRGRGFPKMMRQLGLDPAHDEIDFARFVRALARQRQEEMNPHWRVQYFNVFMDMIEYDQVIRYEEVSGAIADLVARFYPEAADAPSAVISANRHARNSDDLVEGYFTPDLKATARDVYRLDFETFGYEP